MSDPQAADALAEAFAAAMRDSFRAWIHEHGNGRQAEELWTQDVDRIELSAHYTPQHRGVVVVEVVSKRPGRSELYPFALSSQNARTRLQRRRGEV